MQRDCTDICPAMIDQGAQALAERIGKLNADLFRGAAEAVLRAALSDKPSPGDSARTGETARGEACDLAPSPSTQMRPVEDAIAFVREFSRRDPVFAKGHQKGEIQRAKDIVAEIDRLAATTEGQP